MTMVDISTVVPARVVLTLILWFTSSVAFAFLPSSDKIALKLPLDTADVISDVKTEASCAIVPLNFAFKLLGSQLDPSLLDDDNDDRDTKPSKATLTSNSTFTRLDEVGAGDGGNLARSCRWRTCEGATLTPPASIFENWSGVFRKRMTRTRVFFMALAMRSSNSQGRKPVN